MLANYSLPLRAEYLFTLHQSVAQNLSDVWVSTLETGEAQLRSVADIAEITVRTTKQKPYPVWFSCRPEAIRYGFRFGPKLSGMVFVSARSYPVRFSCRPKAIRYGFRVGPKLSGNFFMSTRSNPVWCAHSLSKTTSIPDTSLCESPGPDPWLMTILLSLRYAHSKWFWTTRETH